MTEMSQYSQFIAKSRYARWLPEEGRRETWEETVDRYVQFFKDRGSFGRRDGSVVSDIKTAILDLEVMPSMRCMMTAGPALGRDNVAGFNCSYLAIDHQRSFDELMYVLMCGTGVGFSVERQYVTKLPEIAEEFHETDSVIVVADSKIGWASSFRELVSMLYSGRIPRWDVSRVRASGSPLKTFGGRASGPEPLEDLFRFSVSLFQRAAGRRLTSIECHDLVCKIADIVVVGGVRRSALISLSNLTDGRMARAKHGQWWIDNPQRALANNSVCYTEKPDFESFLAEWSILYESKSGERGVFSRSASQNQAGKSGRRDPEQDFGTNPCSEIILRPSQFCNLSEVVVRYEDTIEDLKRKVRIATILGTLQSTLTNFRYLRNVWKKNTEEERLLGVSLTGIMDHPILSGQVCTEDDQLENWLTELREVAIETNKEWAAKLGVEPSVAITCVKPSGTVSQLVDSASGIHPRYSGCYIRRVRADVKDPLAQWMKEEGVPCEPDVTKPDSNLVFSFPCKAPEGCVTVDQVSAMDQLELWKIYQEHWCEHKPSITVYYRDDEFLQIGQWLWDNFDSVSGISFLPYSDHTYQQAPYEPIDEEMYETMKANMPSLCWEEASKYEGGDLTSGSQTMACTGGVCEVVDLT
jgi:ribonucleoside-diphosphate reductase alpha chain